MRTLAVIAPPGARHSGIAAVLDLCHLANRYAAALYEPEEPTLAVGVKVLSIDGGPVVAADGRQIHADGAVALGPAYDGVFVAATAADPTTGPDDGPAPLSVWLADQYRRGAWAAGCGEAVFLLAQARLLAGGRCAPPWRLEQAFRRRHRDIAFEVGRAVVQWDRTLTAGAIGSEPLLALQLIEAVCARNLADVLAKITRIGEAVPADEAAPALTGARHDDRVVARAQDALQRNFSHEVSLEALAAELGVSHRTLLRRFRKATGQTPTDYLQTLRVESAKQMLAKSTRPIERIGFMAGYADSRFFKQVFRRKVGLTPAEFRRQARAIKAPPPQY